MGSYASPTNDQDVTEPSGERAQGLGDLLSGRFEEVDFDSVDAVREVREQQ